MQLVNSLKYLVRDRVGTVCMLFALTFAMVLGNIGSSVYNITNNNIDKINRSYTTIAIESFIEPEYDEADTVTVNGWSFNTTEHPEDISTESLNRLSSLPYVKKNIQRKACVAVNRDLTTLATGSLEPLDYKGPFDKPYDIACFVIRCVDVKSQKDLASFTMFDDGSVADSVYTRSYTIYAEVLNAVLLHPSYPVPKFITVAGRYLGADNEVPFQNNEMYFVWGIYYDVPVNETHTEQGKLVRARAEGVIPQLGLGLYEIGSREEKTVQGEKWQYMHQPENFPVYIQRGAQGYNSKVAYITGIIDRNLHQIPVIALESLDTMLLFHEQKANIVKGRQFRPEEIANGSKVCIVNVAFAALNKLSLGDTLSLPLCDTSYEKMPMALGNIWTPKYMLSNDLDFESAEYTIIGIYSMPLWQVGDHNFSPNTIFVPVNAVCKAYFQDMPLLRSLVLQNGSEKKFGADTAALGLKDRFVYLDQGYSAIEPSVSRVSTDARWLFLASCLVWLLVVLTAMFVYIRRQKGDIRIIRLLGTNRLHTLRYLLFSSGILLLFASVAGVIVSMLVADKAVGFLFSINEMKQSMFSIQSLSENTFTHPDNSFIIICCGAIQFLVSLALVTCLIVRLFGKTALMQKSMR